jgi:hypothetical protein
MSQKTKVLLELPISLVNKIRFISANRKATQHPNRTQKAVIIELLQNGLVVTDTTPTPPHEDTTTTAPQAIKEINNTLPIF